MKHIFSLVLILSLSMALLTSCDDSKTYAELLKDEKTTIADYIERNNIQVVTGDPEDITEWTENLYVKTSTGIYFHLVSPGDTTVKEDSIETNDLINVRYIQYTLTTKPDTIFSLNTIDSPYPTSFNYADYTQSCTAWHEAVSYMKYNEAQAKIIVPSKLGFDTYMESVTPMGYDMKIQFRK